MTSFVVLGFWLRVSGFELERETRNPEPETYERDTPCAVRW